MEGEKQGVKRGYTYKHNTYILTDIQTYMHTYNIICPEIINKAFSHTIYQIISFIF